MNHPSFWCEFVTDGSNPLAESGFAPKVTKKHLNGAGLSRNTGDVPHCGTGWVGPA
jgi:hypothetical protein